MKKKIVYIDMDGVLCDFAEAKQKCLEDFPEMEYPQCQMDFFRQLLVIPGAYAAVAALDKVYDVYILSSPSYKNPMSYTEKMLWVKDHFGEKFVRRLILSKHKHLNIGDYLIDDRLANGADKFTGEHIHFDTEQFPDWNSVLRYLL